MAKKSASGKATEPSAANALISALNAKPDAKNWDMAVKLIQKSNATYYWIKFPSGVGKKEDLTSAYAIVYDAKYRELFRVPVIERRGKDFEGATHRLKGLLINRRMIK